MREVGSTWLRSSPETTHEAAEKADVVVTMGCGDECPYIPGKRSSTGTCKTRKDARSRSPRDSRRHREPGGSSPLPS